MCGQIISDMTQVGKMLSSMTFRLRKSIPNYVILSQAVLAFHPFEPSYYLTILLVRKFIQFTTFRFLIKSGIPSQGPSTHSTKFRPLTETMKFHHFDRRQMELNFVILELLDEMLDFEMK
jgi:hypothetical protein